MKYQYSLKQNWMGVLVAVTIGAIAISIRNFTKIPILDPLLIALVLGMLIRTFIKFNDKFVSGFNLTPLLFIPIGVIFYGAVNLNFVKFASVDPAFIFIVFIVFMIYVISTLFLSYLFGLREKLCRLKSRN